MQNKESSEESIVSNICMLTGSAYNIFSRFSQKWPTIKPGFTLIILHSTPIGVQDFCYLSAIKNEQGTHGDHVKLSKGRSAKNMALQSLN